MLKKSRSRLLMRSFSALAVLLLLLSACNTVSTTHSAGGKPVKGGTWIDDLLEEPDSLIPNASTETFAAMVDYALWAPLVYGTPDGQLMPGLLTEVPALANQGISPDLKTWTLHFRSGLKWSDGQPLDARDMDFTWKLWDNPRFSANNTINVADIASASVSTDHLSITFHLKDPLVSFMANWADGFYGPMPAHHFASVAPEAILKSADNLNPKVTSGPFRMSESKPTDHYTVVRNPNYYLASQGLPYLDKVVFRIVPDQDSILKDLRAGAADSAYFLDVTKAPVYESLSNYTLVADPRTYSFEALYFDFHNKVLANNREVRQAMAMAVDQQTLIAVSRRGLGGPLCTDHTVTQTPGYTQGIQCPRFDLNAANTLLDRHGWKMGADGVRNKNGQRLEFQYTTMAGSLWRSDDELINQQNFAGIGIKVDIIPYPSPCYTFMCGPPSGYNMIEFATTNGYDPDDAALFQCNNPSNITSYCNPALDEQYKIEQASTDPAVRQVAFDKIHQIELTGFPFVVEFSAPNVAIHKKGTNNYTPSLVGVGETENIWLWWCNGGACP